LLGDNIEFGRILLKLESMEGTPIEKANKQPGLVQNLLTELKSFDPVMHAYVTPAENRGQMLILIANIINHAAAYSPSGPSAMDLFRMQNTCRQLGAQLRVNPVLDADEYRAVTGRAVKDEVQEYLTRGLSVGIPLGEIVNAQDVEKLRQSIEENERLLEAAVHDQFGNTAQLHYEASGDSVNVNDTVELPPVATNVIATDIASSSGTAIEGGGIQEAQIEPPNFGGGAPSTEAALPTPQTQQSQTPAAPSAAQTLAGPTPAVFTGPNIAETP
jgi:hypothetical protein